jgi:hypothetical protein
MKLLRIVLILPIIILSARAQNIVVTTGTAQREWSRNESRVEAENKTEEMATINAIEKAFGKVVIQGNSTYIENSNNGSRIETKSMFSTIANTFVKGEVIEVLDKKFEEVRQTVKIGGQKTDIIELVCNVKVRVRELSEPKVDFVVRPTPCEDEFRRCQATVYKHGDPFYLYFRAPESGYLMVYYDMFDGKSYKLLPYEKASSQYENGIPVKANEDYLFFSSRNNVFDNVGFHPISAYVTEGKYREQLRLFIVFSKQPIPSPMLSTTNTVYTGVATEKYKLPSNMLSEDFQRWVHKLKMGSAQCTFDYKDITIER